LRPRRLRPRPPPAVTRRPEPSFSAKSPRGLEPVQAPQSVEAPTGAPTQPLAALSGPIKAVGALAAGASTVFGATGFLAEASYSRLLGIDQSLSAPVFLYAGVQFFITLLTVSLFFTFPAVALLLIVAALGYAARRLFPAAPVFDRLEGLLGRPGLLWTAQIATYVFLSVLSLPAFADLLPLADLAYNKGLLTAHLDTVREGALHYRAVVLHVCTATLMVVGLEAWRMRLHRRGQYKGRLAPALSLVLALPLYVLVSIELLLLPIGHGLLKLPSLRQYSASVVTFKNSVPQSELKGKTLLLLQLKPPNPRFTFYCPQGPKVWPDVDPGVIELIEERPRNKLVVLLEDFRPLAYCQIAGRPQEEVAK
jgi:hypothetical protein